MMQENEIQYKNKVNALMNDNNKMTDKEALHL